MSGECSITSVGAIFDFEQFQHNGDGFVTFPISSSQSDGVLSPDGFTFEDIGVLVVSHPRVTYSQAVFSGLAEMGGIFVACNSNRLPVGMLLPLSGNHIQVARYALQAAASQPTKKRLWKQIVQSKIKSQARLLVKRTDDDHGVVSVNQALSHD